MIVDHLKELRTWLFEGALPLWLKVGEDSENGGFSETVTLDCLGSADLRRGRVNPRMVFVYCEAGRLGWDGPWMDVALRTQAYIERVFGTSQGYIGALASPAGELVDASFGLYNQAFALLALYNIADVNSDMRSQACTKAAALLDVLNSRFKHPIAGFQEAEPPRAPLRANPHMHLFEMCLDWESSENLSAEQKAVWVALADELGDLCLTHLICSKTGGLREFFALDWTPALGAAGKELEPGHHMEWAWLLLRWSKLRGDERAKAAAMRLFEIAETHGVDRERGVIMMGINDDFSPRDTMARLWCQAEWLKASIAMLECTPEEEWPRYQASLSDALGALEMFLKDVPFGLWKDKCLEDGSFVNEAAPASSLYHIVSAISELDRFLKTEVGQKMAAFELIK
ncbi:Cellobiose 2-epimerase [Pseudovibrio axinellae]|uniref:Cellobiose 2-epimerase n=1 Tax=Pseudovibrio axinellae TaxID=989403 RepID=A0A161V6X8_9HYPH|nr:AGE family epimerase/isomerase [Pseudovibrio axinellae]KZL20671.1 Cellobiose 2-epimerase [Pseudovibrio axinellae]SER26193.1 mannose-6-phosphate isomerase, type 3 [Pseudovibrio axinellae]